MSEYKNCPPIYNAFGLDRLNKIPVLNIGQQCGATDYIDFIGADEMEHSIMKGIDRYKRPFIALKVVVTKDNKSKEIVGTFFQRYTDDNVSWAFGTCYQTNVIYQDSRVRLCDYETLEKRLKLLLDKQIIKDLKCGFHEEPDYVNGNGNYDVYLFKKDIFIQKNKVIII